MTTIIETIHHGDYHNVRHVEVDTLNLGEVADLILGAGTYAKNARLATLASALVSGGSYSYGWVTWEVAS